MHIFFVGVRVMFAIRDRRKQKFRSSVYILLGLYPGPESLHRELHLAQTPPHALPSGNSAIESQLSQRQRNLLRDMHVHVDRRRLGRIERAAGRSKRPETETTVGRVQAPGEDGRLGSCI